MTVEFVPNGEPYSYRFDALQIEDREGNVLYRLSTDEDATSGRISQLCDQISKSKKPFSFVEKGTFPVGCDSPNNFLKSLFIPELLPSDPSITNRVARVAVAVFNLLVGLITLPLRLLTAIPYLIFRKLTEEREEDKIVDLIKSHPCAKGALSEGRVLVNRESESYVKIQPGTMNGERVFQIEGGDYLNARMMVDFKRQITWPKKNIVAGIKNESVKRVGSRWLAYHPEFPANITTSTVVPQKINKELLSDHRLLSPQDIRSRFRECILRRGGETKIKKSKEMNDYSTVLAKGPKGEQRLFALYRGKEKVSVGHVNFGIVKYAQDVISGEWCVVKICRSPNDAKDELLAEYKNERDALAEKGLLLGSASRKDRAKGEECTYLFKDLSSLNLEV